MLNKFEVKGFKNFKDRFILDLSKKKNYEFNTHLLYNDTIRSGVIFGKNSSGKSNLGLALFDIINHLTDDKRKTMADTKPFLNLNSSNKIAEFKYTFKFDDTILEYEYYKSDEESLVSEKVIIDGKEIIYYDFETMEGYSKLQGTENLNTNLETNNLSFLKYIINNSILEDTKENQVFKKMFTFVNSMLLFYSLNGNRFFGFTKNIESISDGIVRKEKLKDFEKFLNDLEIPCQLIAKEIDGEYIIYNQFEFGETNFYRTASTGTKALALFYYWLISSNDASFIFMDEFDAYYHYELAETISKYIIKERPNAQIFFTSHNTNLMSNELFRPDCLFIIQCSQIKPMSSLIDKELRYAHNLQKMYRAGAFNE
jgi:AAA15 family ATPase/GTPase